MDISLLYLAGLDLVFGVVSLFTVQNVPKKYKGKSWTKSYARSAALSEILMGVLLGAMVLITRNMTLGIPVVVLLIAVAITPSLIWGILLTKKYNALLEQGVE